MISFINYAGASCVPSIIHPGHRIALLARFVDVTVCYSEIVLAVCVSVTIDPL